MQLDTRASNVVMNLLKRLRNTCIGTETSKEPLVHKKRLVDNYGAMSGCRLSEK